MVNTSAIAYIKNIVKEEMDGICSAHDFFHIERVVKLATEIQKMEGAGDIEIIIIGSLLHEALDDKFFDKDNMKKREEDLFLILTKSGLEHDRAQKVMFIIKNVGFRKSLKRGPDFTSGIEFDIVEDADRLEAIGAIAIARAFAYGGKIGNSVYDPDIKPKNNQESKTNKKNTTINHFYDKLLHLKDMMHTASGKKIAEERHNFMETYLEQFYKERNVEL